MSVKYELFKSPVADRESGEEPVEYARIADGETMMSDRLVEEIADASSFTIGDLRGMLSAFSEGLFRHLMRGESVNLRGVGIFSVGLEMKKGDPEKELKNAVIQFSRVKFRACTLMKRKLSTMHLVHKSKGAPTPELTVSARLELVMAFLGKYPFMTRADYMRITKQEKSAAVSDLNQWIVEGVIYRYGVGNKVVYCILTVHLIK